MGEFYTVAQVADLVGLSPYTIRRYIKQGRITAGKFFIHGQWRIPSASVQLLRELIKNGGKTDE